MGLALLLGKRPGVSRMFSIAKEAALSFSHHSLW
jgi:hypothetical protein